MSKKDSFLLQPNEEKPKEKTVAEKITAIIAKDLNTPIGIKAKGFWIIVEEVEIKPAEKTKAGIYLATGEKQQDIKEQLWEDHPSQGVVLGVGPKEIEQNKDQIKVHDWVYLTKSPRNAIMHNGKWYALVQNMDIACVVGNE